jgi:hypothetical protein
MLRARKRREVLQRVANRFCVSIFFRDQVSVVANHSFSKSFHEFLRMRFVTFTASSEASGGSTPWPAGRTIPIPRPSLQAGLEWL